MTDTKRLAEKIKESTLPAAFLAQQCNLSEAEFNARAEGRKYFCCDEISVLKDFLCLTNEEAAAIFFHRTFKDYCKQNGIKQAELCDLLNLKSVSGKLNGRQPFTLQQIKTICKHYHISADDYFL